MNRLQGTLSGSSTGDVDPGSVMAAVMAVKNAYGPPCLPCSRSGGSLSADGTKCECNPGRFGDLCDIPEGWTDWSKWSQCSRPCGGGTRKRERMCQVADPSRRASVCPGTDVAEESCNLEACPTEWGEWSTCDIGCGHGVSGILAGIQRRAHATAIEARNCTVRCPVVCPGNGCSGHGTCQRTPKACIDATTCR